MRWLRDLDCVVKRLQSLVNDVFGSYQYSRSLEELRIGAERDSVKLLAKGNESLEIRINDGRSYHGKASAVFVYIGRSTGSRMIRELTLG